MTIIRKILPLLTFLCIAGSSAQAATWTTIDVPGSPVTQTFGINNAGDVVGSYVDTAAVTHGYVLSAGNVTTIDAPSSILTVAWSINDTKQVSGYFTGTDGAGHGFLLDGQNFTILDFPGATGTDALGINNAGEVVGAYYTDDRQHFHGFEWVNGTFTTIDVPGAQFTYLYGISNRGKIVGVYAGADLIYHGFVRSPQGAFRKLAIQGSTVALNKNNIVVGVRRNGKFSFKFNLKTDFFAKMRFPRAIHTASLGINDLEVSTILGRLSGSTKTSMQRCIDSSGRSSSPDVRPRPCEAQVAAV